MLVMRQPYVSVTAWGRPRGRTARAAGQPQPQAASAVAVRSSALCAAAGSVVFEVRNAKASSLAVPVDDRPGQGVDPGQGARLGPYDACRAVGVTAGQSAGEARHGEAGEDRAQFGVGRVARLHQEGGEQVRGEPVGAVESAAVVEVGSRRAGVRGCSAGRGWPCRRPRSRRAARPPGRSGGRGPRRCRCRCWSACVRPGRTGAVRRPRRGSRRGRWPWRGPGRWF